MAMIGWRSLPLAAAVTGLGAHAALAAGNPLLEPRSVTAVRAEVAVRIDGVLDEPTWATAPGGEQFIQSRPAPGEPARLHTRFQVLFDDHALYVGVRLEDPAAAAIQAPLGRRDDENSSDWCFVEIDSRRDRRTAYSFGVNPAGMQVDGVFVNDIEYDSSWNAVWEVATRVDASGWTAEYRIPFSVFAFHTRAGEPMRWGINVYRSNPHTGESSNWSPRVPQLAGVVSLFNELVVAATPDVRRLDITPYALVGLTRRSGSSSESSMRAGVDANIGLTPSASLAATILPDFGQVEADPTQLNLTTFELFQQERRPFFTEGIDAFKFDTALSLETRGDSFADEAPFYSRRIGRDADLLGAVKLFGRTTAGWRTGVLAAVTDGADATTAAGTRPVAARTEAAVARVVREADAGNAAVGAFAGGLHRELAGALADQLTRDAVAAGVDGRIRWSDHTYEARMWALATDQLGSRAAIAELAAQPWHNLGRPDAPRLRLADGATHMAGTAAEARLAKLGGDLTWAVTARAISPGFDVNGIGFQRNSDWLVVSAQWAYQRFPHVSWLRRWRLGSDNAGIGWSWGGERRAAVVSASLQLDFANSWDATVSAGHEAQVLSTEQLRGGPALALPPRDVAELTVHTDTRRTSTAGLYAKLMREPGSGSRSATIQPSLTVRLSDHLAGTLNASYQDQQVGWQLVAGPGTAPAGTYLIGRLHQRAASLSLQADVAISPQLIVQLYAQPFATVGRYRRYALLADPRAADPAARFADLSAAQLTIDGADLVVSPAGAPSFRVARPDGIGRTLIASAVVRWELRPGSFLTAVWSHRGEAAVPAATPRLAPELRRVLVEPGDDTVLVKLGWRWAP